MSEYTQRYQHVSHKELYQGVNAGDPKQIDGLSAQWSSMKDTLEGLGQDLTKDLDALTKTWTGDAAREFHQRLNLVVGYSGNLAEGMTGIRQALSMMATELRTAQHKAESPEETDDNDKLIDGAVKGFLTGGAAGAVIGGFVGHKQDEAEQEKAHQRMVQVVASLAEGYDFSAYGRVVVPEEPDNRLPGNADKTGPTLTHGPSVGTPSGGPTSGTFSSTSAVHHTGPTSGTAGVDPSITTGVGTPGTIGSVSVTDPAGTSLAGAAPPLTSTGPTTGLSGATFTGSAPTTGGNSFFGVPGAGTGSLAGSTGGLSGRPIGLENRSAAGTGRLAGGRGVVVDAEGRSNGGKGTGARAAMPGRNGVLGKHGRHGEDESGEHLTWLTEDEMVWGDGTSAPPSVLGTD